MNNIISHDSFYLHFSYYNRIWSLFIYTQSFDPKEFIENVGSNTFSKVVGYKINIEKSVVFLCRSNEQTTSEIKKTNPL